MKTHKQIMSELEQNDIKSYNEIKENTEKVKKEFEHGGKRKGAGRRTLALTVSKNRSVRLTDAEYEKFRAQGGVKWLREKLKEVS